MGDRRRVRSYPLFLSVSDLTNLRSALGDLDEYSRPFYIKDHEGDYWPARLVEDPLETWDNVTNKHITLNLVEIL